MFRVVTVDTVIRNRKPFNLKDVVHITMINKGSTTAFFGTREIGAGKTETFETGGNVHESQAVNIDFTTGTGELYLHTVLYVGCLEK